MLSFSVEGYLNNWLDSYGNCNLKPTTIAGYKMYARNYIVPYLGSYDLVNLTPFIVQDWIWKLQKEGRVNNSNPLNSKTVIQAFRILSKCLGSAVRLQLLSSNPCALVELPRKKKYRYNYLRDQKQIADFIRAFKGTEFYLPVLLAVSLGLRRGELLGLKWSDFDYETKSLLVQRSVIIDLKNIVMFGDLKNESSYRLVLVPDFILSLLADLSHDHELIFCTNNGGLLNPSSFSNRFSILRKKLGLPYIRFHDLRHTNASFLYSSGIDMRVIQDMLGHSTITTTIDTYTHTNLKNQVTASATINSMLEQSL